MRRHRWLVLALLGALWGVLRPGWGQLRSVTLVSTTGATTVRRSGTAAYAPAARSMSLAAGDIVRTGPTGGAILLFPDGSTIKIAANSALIIPDIRGTDGPQRVQLQQGQLYARITRGRAVRFEAGRTAVAGVRDGGELNLNVRANQEATLTVVGGEARFSNHQGSVVVREGQQSTAQPVVVPAEPPYIRFLTPREGSEVRGNEVTLSLALLSPRALSR